jgi:hypothetical protein
MFSFTTALHDLVRHIAEVVPEMSHIDPNRLLIAYRQCRTPGVHGVFASCQPLRFAGGAQTIEHRGRTFEMPPVTHEGHEILYIIHFSVPRFLNLSFEAKLMTVFHELYHISPDFDGDIRRFAGRKYAHGHSRKAFNRRLEHMISGYLSHPEAPARIDFLHHSFDDLQALHGNLIGLRIMSPKPRPVHSVSCRK